MKKPFKKIKAIITANAMKAFPDYSIPSHVYTDASVNHQATNLPLQRKIILDPAHYQHQEIEGYEAIHISSPARNGVPIWKIVIPSTLLPQLLIWYHLVLGHCGQQRLYNTVCARFY